MIDRSHQLSVTRQAKALRISRGSAYYRPRPVSDADLALMRRIEELHMDYPFAGSRMLQGLLLGKGAWRDNVFVKRLWRTIKYEEVYLHAYSNVPKARAAIGKYLNLYNTKRPHSSLGG